MKAKRLQACAGSGFFVLVGLTILQHFSTVLAQTRPDYQTVGTFFDAIASGDTNAASQLLESHTNLVFCSYAGGKLPLLEAAAAGNLPLVKHLLELGADINAVGDTLNSGNAQMTALDEAAQSGHLEVCKFLLEAGANPNHRAFSLTTLHFVFNDLTAITNRNNVARLLLDYGANPFAEAGYYRTTPFELEITRSDGRLIPMMLDANRRIKVASKPAIRRSTGRNAVTARERITQFLAAHGEVMLSAAAQRGEIEAVQSLLRVGVSAKTNAGNGYSLLQAYALSAVEAAKARPAAIVQWEQTSNMLMNSSVNASPGFLAPLRIQLADQMAKVESLSPERWLQVRDLLIKNGADYDAFAATALGDTDRVEHLLSADKNVIGVHDCNGETPLHWAVKTDRLPLTSFWIQSGVPLVVTNSAGQTALHLAAARGLAEHVKLLLAANAPTNIRDTNGWTPLDSAIQAKQTDCIHLLMARTPAAHPERGMATTLHEAAASGNVAALAALLETTTNLEARNELGLTPLQVAVLHGHLAAAALLVDKGADVNVRDPDGNTLLHQIFLQERYEVYDRPPASWLARLGQDLRRKTYVKYLTVGQNEQGPNPVLQGTSFLLACGLDPTATNHAGQTVMQLITEEKIGRGIFFFDNDREELFKLLAARGGNVDERDTNGNTALHRLCRGFYDVNKVEGMAGLIASGADVNATNNLGQTPLHVAAEKIGLWDNNDPPVNAPFQLLIYSKANVNAQDNQGLTPLDVVATSDSSFRTEATRALLDARANPNLRDKRGRTAAHLFLSGKWPWGEAGGCIDMLVAAGADLSTKDNQGKTPLHYLAALGSQNPMFFIRGIGDTFTLAKVDINARDNDGDTPLQLAAKTGTKDVYDWLVKQGASQDAPNNAGETPRQQALRSTNVFSDFRFNPDTDIFQAIREGKLESVAAILKSEPDLLNKTNQFGQTPLSVAVQSQRTNIIDFLDQQGVQWDPRSALLTDRTNILRNLVTQQPRLAANGSLLRLAATRGNLSVVEMLLAAGADMKAADPFGLSSLGYALASQHSELASLLVKQGATENIFDAVFSGDTETAAALIGKDKSLAFATNAIRVSVAEIAASTGKDKVLKLLLDKGVAPNFQNPFTGKSLLCAAANYNQTNTAELLLQRRARSDVADNSGFSPIHVAALKGSIDVLELLHKHKADANLRTAAPDMAQPPLGSRPPFFGRREMTLSGNTALHLAAMTGQTNVIPLLLKWGASVNATNADGMTPLDLAAQVGQFRYLMLSHTDMRIPFTPPPLLRDNPILRRGATIALLEQAGGKRGERRGPAGMMPFGQQTMTRFTSMASAPAPQAPVLQTGADYHAQGCVDYNSHRFTNSLADFRKSCELGSDNQDYSYFRIWLIRARLGEEEAATQELAAYLERRKAQKPDDWPSKVGRFLASQLSETDFVKAADDANIQTDHEQHCEAYFYAGSKRLIENDKMGAVGYFKKCLTTNVTNFEEYTSAASELLRLQMPVPGPN